MSTGTLRLIIGGIGVAGMAVPIVVEVFYGKIKEAFEDPVWPTLIRLGAPLVGIVVLIVGIVLAVVMLPH